MKKIFLLSFIFIPLVAMAAGVRVNCPTEGFVPCGTKDCPCQLCDFFVMFDRIVDFVLFKLVPPVATLMLVIGGVMFFAAAGDPGKLSRAKGLLTSVVIGLVIVYGAWLLISAFFMAIGVAEWTGLKEGWFNYPCP